MPGEESVCYADIHSIPKADIVAGALRYGNPRHYRTQEGRASYRTVRISYSDKRVSLTFRRAYKESGSGDEVPHDQCYGISLGQEVESDSVHIDTEATPRPIATERWDWGEEYSDDDVALDVSWKGEVIAVDYMPSGWRRMIAKFVSRDQIPYQVCSLYSATKSNELIRSDRHDILRGLTSPFAHAEVPRSARSQLLPWTVSGIPNIGHFEANNR